MKKRGLAGFLTLAMCLSLIQPASGLEMTGQDADVSDAQEVAFHGWFGAPNAPTQDENGAWKLYVSQNITKKALLEQLPKQAEVVLTSPETVLEPTPEITPETSPETTPEVTPETTPETTPEVTPEVTPEAALLSNGEGVPVTPSVPSQEPEPTPSQEPEPTPSQEPESDPSQESEPAPIQLDLNWSLTGEFSTLPKGGTLTATASLPDGYVSAAASPLPTITVQAKDPWAEFANFECPGIDLLGTKINLFDYWTEVDEEGSATPETRFEPDFHGFNHAPFYAFPLRHNGINKDTPLKFWQGGPKGAANPNDYEYNIWTDNKGAPLFGIVKPVLENRYPFLAAEPNDVNDTYQVWCSEGHNDYAGERWYADSDKARSLDYLFDPTIPYDGKASFERVTGLLQVDEDGYYYYDSTKNFAAFDEKNNKFHLYNLPGVPGKNTDITSTGQFFPFNTPDQVFKFDNGVFTPKIVDDVKGELPENLPDNSDAMNRMPFINHYFGMTMTTRFAQRNGGTTYRGEPTTYEFSGDDDVWVFIDDVLVADLGGIHNAASLSINFATGDVIITAYDATTEARTPYTVEKTTIRQKFKDAEREGSEEDWRGNTFADDTYHTLRFFFMERGNNESNVKLKFNMVVIPESQILKTDQAGNPVDGAEFALYAADENYNTQGEPIKSGYTVDGRLPLLDDETGGPLAFAELAKEAGTNYFVLRETSVPDGYRQNSDTYLHFYPETGVTLSEKQWQTGSYSQTVLTATVGNELQEVDANGNPIEGNTWHPYDEKNEGGGLNGCIYAVPFRYMGDTPIYTKDQLTNIKDSDWRPVIPSDDKLSWEVLKGNAWEHIVEAVTSTAYGMESAIDGSYKIKVPALPGNPNSYYFLWEKRAEDFKNTVPLLYTVNYYYVEGDKINDAASYHCLEPSTFGRDFSVSLHIPNIKNYLVVHKYGTKDNASESLDNVTFHLYAAKDVQVHDDGSYTILNNAQPYDSVTTQTRDNTQTVQGTGLAIFPSTGKNLKMGDYYLVEDKGTTPAGYEPYSGAIHVIVDNAGVYVDAGEANDGLTTSRYVGTVVHSMRQFAMDDQVDATLHDIKVQMQTTDDYRYDADNAYANQCTWSDWKENLGITDAGELHLQYNNTGKPNKYGSTFDNHPDEKDSILDEVNEGWSQLYIRQCKGQWDSVESPKQDLGTDNLRNLFSTVMVVHVENKSTDSPITPTPTPPNRCWKH